MAYLRIKNLYYFGDNYFYESPNLDKNIIVVEGPNGVGKSTFFELLYFSLGGNVEKFDKTSKKKHEQIAHDTNNRVEIIIEIDGSEYKLIRSFSNNSIIISGDENVTDLPINRSKSGVRIFSDWLLEKLKIDVVTMTQGGHSFKLNIEDLFRLIYHNQNSDPEVIYKPHPESNFVSDSLYVRKAIFEVLAGSTLMNYYKTLSEYKSAEKRKNEASAIYNEYKKLVDEIAGSKDDIVNAEFLKKKLSECENRLVELLGLRKECAKIVPSSQDGLDDIEELKRKKSSIEYKLSHTKEKRSGSMKQLRDLLETKKQVSIDVERIEKIITTHNQLKLFSPDTCPYCLTEVERPANKCLCGADVKEDEYQRFFYSVSEYVEILKSKISSLESIEKIELELTSELKRLDSSIEQKLIELADIDAKLAQKLNELSVDVSFEKLESVDESIFDIKEQIAQLERSLKLEEKLFGYDKKLTLAKQNATKKHRELKQAELDSETELETKLKGFNSIYNSYMTKSLRDVRKAEIDKDTYLPIINDGVYREASAGVAKRLLYFLTFLKLSLRGKSPYPKLLLVDTPETAGIDKGNMDVILSNIEQLLVEHSTDKFQVILATGIDKYPESMKKHVTITLSDEEKLLCIKS